MGCQCCEYMKALSTRQLSTTDVLTLTYPFIFLPKAAKSIMILQYQILTTHFAAFKRFRSLKGESIKVLTLFPRHHTNSRLFFLDSFYDLEHHRTNLLGCNGRTNSDAFHQRGRMYWNCMHHLLCPHRSRCRPFVSSIKSQSTQEIDSYWSLLVSYPFTAFLRPHCLHLIATILRVQGNWVASRRRSCQRDGEKKCQQLCWERTVYEGNFLISLSLISLSLSRLLFGSPSVIIQSRIVNSLEKQPSATVLYQSF